MDPMQRVQLASFIPGSGLYLVLASPAHVGGPLHLLGGGSGPHNGKQVSKTTSGTHYGWIPGLIPAENITLIYNVNLKELYLFED